MPKLTSRLITSTPSGEKDIILRDSELKGFLCKITPMGKQVFMLYYRTREGRERKPVIGVHGAITCDKAREIAKKWLAIIAEGGDPSATKQEARSTPTMEEFWERYLTDYARPNKKSRSVEEDERLWRLHIDPYFGKHRVTSITKADVARFHASMSAQPANANRARALLSKMFNLAELWGIREDNSNPCRHVKKYKESKKERFLSLTEIATLSEVLNQAEQAQTEQPAAIAAIRLLLFTGCRRNEILTLRWDEVDADKACLRLRDSKTGAKVVYLNAPALEVLSALEKQPENPHVLPGLREGHHFVNIEKAWRRIRSKAGLDDVRLHDLRHSFASIGAANNLSLPIVGKMLGHSQARTTERYAHLHDDPVRAATELIGERIRAAARGNQAEVISLHKKA